MAVPDWALQAILPTSRRFIVSPRDDRARTIESGSRGSHTSLSTYDKRNQLIDRWGFDIRHELSRIEARVKLDDPLLLADPPSLDNPFDEVTAHLLEPARDAPAGFKIIVRAARLVGLPRLGRAHHWVAHTDGSRTAKPLPQVLDRGRFVDLLNATGVNASAWRAHPRRVFARRWGRVARQLLRDLRRP